MHCHASELTSPDNYFEDFQPGQVFRHARGKTMTEMDNVLLTNMVMNTAAAHFDEHLMKTAFAGLKGFDTRVVFGGINFSLVLGLAAQDTGEQVLQELALDQIRLLTPVHHGDTLYAFTEVLETTEAERDDAGIVTFRHYGVNQNDEMVFTGNRKVLMKRRSAWAK
ncbi:MaoC family dehydratase [Lutimaribacter marinistellae]|uniref:MaoC family dehydratase n=1 Tax=Lutimaribacter marinistellae TaxID=1820329 RepID=A0ABV7TDI6_9RHOB